MKNIWFLRHYPLLYLERKWNKLRSASGPSLTGKLINDLYGVKYEYDFSLDPVVIRRMYYKLYEFYIVRALKEYLKVGGTYIDIGSNIGYIAAVGAGLVGPKGTVHCFEPVKKYYGYLARLIELNPQYKVIINNFALGEREGTFSIRVSNLLGSSSLVDSFCDDVQSIEEIQIRRFDNYIQHYDGVCPSLIKIDTEGYEYFVLKGMEGFFKEHKNQLPPILIEVTPSVYQSVGVDIHDFEKYMQSYGYRPYCFVMKRFLKLDQIKEQRDILFLHS